MKLYIAAYTDKLMQMTDEELNEEFTKAISRDPNETDYDARCIAIENEIKRRGIMI